MGRKPSVTKQIGEALGTDDKREQLQRVQNLLTIANDIPVAVTVLYGRGVPFVTVTAPVKVDTQQTKAILAKAIEQLTRMEVQQELRDSEPDPATDVPDEVPGPKTGDVMANGDITP